MLKRCQFKLLTTCLICLSSFTQCQSQNKKQSVSSDTLEAQNLSVKGSFDANTNLTFDRSSIGKFYKSYPRLKVYEPNTVEFYKQREQYVWFNKNGLIEQTHNLVNRILNLKNEGIDEQVPYETEMKRMVGLDSTSNSNEKVAINAATELMLTNMYFFFADKVWSASRSSDIKGWYLPRKKLAYSSFLDSALNRSPDLKEPVISQYMLLKKWLAKYDSIEESGSWKPIAVKNNSFGFLPGDTSAIIGQVKKYLHTFGDLEADNHTNKYDADMAEAVKNFKARFGLTESSMIDKAVINKMNIPVADLIKKMIVNMERCRWVPIDYETQRYILVNIPEFKLHYFENKKLTFACNVVVGKVMTKTVIFAGDMKNIVFSPYWYVPPSIIAKEIKPGMARNPNYLAAHRMEWNGGNVRQKPGANNSLGLVKFLFPNSNNIYLHDSPAKELFNEPARAFSHGCIRVAKPKQLAVELLKDDPNWTEAKIDAAMHAGSERYYAFKYPVKVYIGYFTAWVDHTGKLNFRNDVYSRDNELEKMLLASNTPAKN
ncbi:L,D-transpeptidase family protein [Pedobacter sp. HMF7647]|uniref:L,D-transpeptidase family protein n=1 Tax=Hufsiella arboris TaxID=2695275 RepID=A0A7K1Y4P2_9SPHI|nr:L,D-transpeptidase family protein [Hufsiella arboris]MXV49545.1 L,D-transpeptidase family protein [Hufsiella arboris]